MTDDCVFCAIVDGDIPSYTVYEDESAYAFLDANPLVAGHTLVIPKNHHERLNDMSGAELTALNSALGEVLPAVERAVEASGTTVAINNGEDAGQVVPHAHWHVVPRYADDGHGTIHSLFPGGDLSDDEMAEIAAAARDAL